MNKAKFVAAVRKNPFDRHAWEHTELVYEYRGYTYIVTKDNNGYMGESLAAQHRKEQAAIDYKIAHKDDPIPEWNDDAQKAFELFWEYVEGDEM